MSQHFPPPAFEQKICSMDELAERARALPHPVVFTNGVFDILHRGHVTYLAQARALGASLVVAVNSDASVKLLGKGDDRPINAEADRAAVVAALASVDLVVIFQTKCRSKPSGEPAQISMSKAETMKSRICRRRSLPPPGEDEP